MTPPPPHNALRVMKHQIKSAGEFTVSNCKCSSSDTRDKLFIIIEAGVGTLDAFDALIQGIHFDFSGQDSGVNTQHEKARQFGLTRQKKTPKTIYLEEKRDVVYLEESEDPTSFRPEESPEVGTDENAEKFDRYTCIFKSIFCLCVFDLYIQIIQHEVGYLWNY